GVSNGIFDPVASGVGTHVITYSYTDGNGCQADTQQAVTVYALPVVSFNALTDVCLNGPAVLLTGGTPSGGQYFGTGVTNNQFDPALAGIGQHTIQYAFTDGNGCSNTPHKLLR